MSNILISMNANVATIEGAFPVDVVDRAASYFLKSSLFSKAYKAGVWDGRTRLFNKLKKTFPAGLTQHVIKALKVWREASGSDVHIKVTRKRLPSPLVLDYDINGIDLRDYQEEAIETMIEKGAGILHVATGGGKTEIAAAVIKYIGRSTLFLVPGKDLLFQTAERLEQRLGIEIGKIGDGLWEPSDITVALIVSLARIFSDRTHAHHEDLKKLLRSTEVLVMDECHRIAAKTFYKVVSYCPAPYRFAMSGTPLDREDGASLSVIAQSGPVLYKITNAELQDEGVTVPADIFIHHIYSPKIEDEKGVEYAEVYDEGIISNYSRNETIMRKTQEYYDQDKMILILIEKIKHGRILDTLLWGYKRDFLPHEFITGKADSQKRVQVVQEMKSGILKIVIATSIFDEGIDIPALDVIIMAAGGKSRRRTLQRLGRGLRRGKEKLIVVDFFDHTHPFLTRHSKKRMKDYLGEKCFRVIEENKREENATQLGLVPEEREMGVLDD